MKIKSLTFGTVFLFLAMNSFSQQKVVPAAEAATPQQRPTTQPRPAPQQQPATQPRPATPQQPASPQRPTPPQRPVTAADRPTTEAADKDAAEAAEATKAADRTTVDGEMELHLPPPERSGGRPLMEALNERKSTRRFSSRELAPHMMSDLLWAANGVNREGEDADRTGDAPGKRTAPSARDAREIDIYVVTPFGVYLYIPDGHIAKNIKTGDFRKEILAGRSEFAREAPVLLVYVANSKKMEKFDPATRDVFAAVDCGFISQNVYLYCASEHLATVILGNFNKDATVKVLGLRNDKVLFVQPVGFQD